MGKVGKTLAVRDQHLLERGQTRRHTGVVTDEVRRDDVVECTVVALIQGVVIALYQRAKFQPASSRKSQPNEMLR